MPERLQDLTVRLGRLESRLDDLADRLSAGSGDGALIEILLKDNGRRREAEQELASAQAWIQLAQETGGVAAYHMDIVRDELTWSASTFALYGWAPSQKRPTLETWLAAIHPDDRDQAAAVAAGAIEHGLEVRQEYRIVLSDGRVRWIQDRGRVLLDAQGQPSRVVGLNIDVTELKLAQQALAEGEAQFRFTFEHAAVGVAHVTAEGRFDRVNDCLCDLLGYSRQELSHMTFQELTHPEDLALDLQHLNRLTAGEIDSYCMEKRYIGRNGAIIWADLTVSVRRNAAGEPLGFISIVADCRDRKQAQDRLDFVLSELGHRSRNLLSIVQVMIRNTAANAGSVEEMASSLSERIQGLAAAQELLVSGEQTPIDLKDLVHRQLSVFLPASQARVTTSGPPLPLKPQAVQNLGLAFHELATNACKYGSLSTPAGTVAVDWAVDDSATPRLSLTWREMNGPPVRPPERTGFGRRVTETMIAGAFAAEIDLTFVPTGVVWTMAAPLSRLSA